MAKSPKTTSDLAQAARTLGRKGGQRGGPARAESLTASQRTAIARKGGQARQRRHTGPTKGTDRALKRGK